jgi:long-chain acyl-CoA synthetase
MRVEAFLEDSARSFPEKAALVCGDSRMSYAALDEAANRFADGLQCRGFGPGERVLVFMNNSADAVISIFGTLKAGGVFSLVNPGTKAEKLAFLIRKYGAAALVTESRLLPVAGEALRHAAARIVIAAGAAQDGFAIPLEMLLASGSPALPPAQGIDLDLAMIVTTSGSTGVPKGVMMTHANVVAAATSITTYLENVAEDRILSVLPLSFDYGLYQVLMSVKMGSTLILEKSFAFPAAVLQKLRSERVTGFPVVPTMAAMLLQRRDLAPGMFPDLRYVSSTGAALPPAHIRQLRGLFPAARIYSMYGLTECKRCTYLPPGQLDARPDSVGIAIPGTEAYVVDDEGRPAAPGVTGELVIRGAHVFKGYWDDEAETARMLRPGPYPWERVLYTGDLFRRDAEGYLYFVGRKDDIIKTLGEKVSPKEVENVLYALDGVRQAVVVGVPDEMLGMSIKAVVAADPEAGLTERDVIAHCARHLESVMVPSRVEFRDELPQTVTGKLRRGGLLAGSEAMPA